MRFARPTTDEIRGAVLAGLIVVEVLLVCYACMQVYLLGRPPKRTRSIHAAAQPPAQPHAQPPAQPHAQPHVHRR